MNSIPELVAALQGTNDSQRAAALDLSLTLGAPCIVPVSALLANPDTETRRAAKRALAGIVHHAGKNGLGAASAQAETALLAALATLTDEQARREVIWFLSEIGQAKTIAALATLLQNVALREDARCALQRIPGDASLAALQNAFNTAPEEFKFALAESLRKRGVSVQGYPSQRLVPTKPTSVKAVG